MNTLLYLTYVPDTTSEFSKYLYFDFGDYLSGVHTSQTNYVDIYRIHSYSQPEI